MARGNPAEASKPTYPRPPIGSVETLARVLGTDPATLRDLATRDGLYRHAGTKKKSNGTERILWEAREPLKTIQARITERILRVVKYSQYLQGALEGRDYVSNATLHAGKRALLSLDIAEFYPSCHVSLVRSIWSGFFCFPPDVADILTALTTRGGALPQGASSSSYIANLVFWKSEEIVFSRFHANGLVYTRFVDDIHVSADRPLLKQDKSEIIEDVMGMVCSHGFRIHRGKLQVSDRSKNMTVHRLNVKAKQPTLPGKKRKQIRACVHRLEQLSESSRSGRDYRCAYHKALGRASLLKRLHPKEGQGLVDRVKAIRPIPSDAEVASLRSRVRSLCGPNTRYIARNVLRRRLARVRQQIGEIRHARPNEANTLLAKLRDSSIQRK